jgi:hypothetical protein
MTESALDGLQHLKQPYLSSPSSELPYLSTFYDHVWSLISHARRTPSDMLYQRSTLTVPLSFRPQVDQAIRPHGHVLTVIRHPLPNPMKLYSHRLTTYIALPNPTNQHYRLDLYVVIR